MAEPPPEILDHLAEFHPGLLDLALWVRGAVLAAEPDLVDRLYRGWDAIGLRHPDAGYVCGIFPRADEVRLLFEHGARLDDPEGVLVGTGSQTRFIPVREPDERVAATIGRYVQEAVALRLFRR